jgi:PAS domain S-box-containing protein
MKYALLTSLWSRLNLASRLILSTGLIGVLSIGVMSYLAIRDQASFEREKLASDLQLDLDSTATSIDEHVITRDYSTVQKILAIRAGHEHIRRAAWVDRTGHLLEAKKEPPEKKVPGWFLKWINIPDLEGSKPLDVGGQNYGQVFLSYTSAHAVNMIWHHFLLQLKIAFSGFVVFLITTMLILKYSLRPLYSLANSAKEFGKGHYSVRIPDAGLPELLPSVGAFNDMADRIQTLVLSLEKGEVDLRESERKYRKIFENVQDVFYQTDLNGNIIEISPSIQRYSGYAREELLGKPIVDIYSYPEDRAKLLDAMDKKGEVIDFEVRLRAKDDRLVYTAANSHFLIDEAGNRVGVEGSLRDITERKRLEEQLIRSQRVEAIGQLVGGIAHDFNNILTSIIGYGSLLQAKMGPDDPSREHVDYILESADKAAQLVHSLLAFSRKQILSPKPENLNEIIKRMEKLLKPIIREDIELMILLDERNLSIIADAGQIEQVLMNLAANARDAMPEGGSLIIRSEFTELDDEFIKTHGYGGPGMYALISVTDTGTGMDKTIQEKIFEPFFTTKEVGKGTGLGLAMVYGLVQQHKGYIDVHSEPGKGTTFRIYIPAIETSPVGETRSTVTSRPPEGTETILLAEDDGALRRLSQTVLQEHGYRVIAAENGEEAIRRFFENRDAVQLLLLDIVMPRRSGKEAYGEIKKIRPDIRVLFVSGYADMADQEGILEEGLDFVSKPVSPKVLLEKVREVLDRKRP